MNLAQTHALVEDALAGGETAYGALLERIRPRLVIWCVSRMSQGMRAKMEPEDAAQEILLALHKGLVGFENRGGRAFFAWVYRIAENRLRDLATYHGAQKRQPGERLSFTQTTPSRAAARVETADRMKLALEQLSEDHRLVIRLRAIEERSFADVAEAMGRRRGATQMLYLRAMQALEEVLRRQGGLGVTSAAGPRSGA